MKPWLKKRPQRTAALLAAAICLPLLGGHLWAWSVDLPPDALSPSNIASVRITARDGTLLREVLSREDGRSFWIPLSQISTHLIQATLAGEDQRFFKHGGVDCWALLRAALLGLTRGRVVSGASTLTMQLSRLLGPIPRSLGGKLRQMALAWKLEQALTKEQILWQYLNRAPYGNGTFGVEAASRRYLNKPASQLSLAEAALLSALPRGPGAYNPYRHRQRLMRRQRYILSQMASQQRITPSQQRQAMREPIDWEAAARPFAAPHLVRRLLGLPEAQGAGRLHATLDLPLQQKVEAAVQGMIQRQRHKGITNAAVLVADNATGEVLAYVGSADFFHRQDHGQVDGTLALRQPGSAIKPFTYALALERGKTPASLLRDLPAHFTTDRGDYHPRNYDGAFHGPVRLRQALGSSYNVPAVRLTRSLGVEEVLSRLRSLGFSSLAKTGRHYGLGLTLGNGEVTLHELVAAYATLARGGSYRPLRLLRAAHTPQGGPLPLARPVARQVVDRRAAFLISSILSDPLARLPAFGRPTVLDVGFPAAVKTGTSKDFRDNWTVGYTPQVTVGVWVGNFDGSSMYNVSGITGAGPLWAEVITLAMEGRPQDQGFARPRGLFTRRICALSGALAKTGLCPSVREEQFKAGTEPAQPCPFHKMVRVDRRNGLLAGAGCAARHVEARPMTIFLPVYRAWALAQGHQPPPTEDSPLCPPKEQRAMVSISRPANGDRYFIDPDLRRRFQSIPLQATVEGLVRDVRWLVNGVQAARAAFPYTANWSIRPGRHTIVAVLPDGQRSDPVTFTVR